MFTSVVVSPSQEIRNVYITTIKRRQLPLNFPVVINFRQSQVRPVQWCNNGNGKHKSVHSTYRFNGFNGSTRFCVKTKRTEQRTELMIVLLYTRAPDDKIWVKFFTTPLPSILSLLVITILEVTRPLVNTFYIFSKIYCISTYCESNLMFLQRRWVTSVLFDTQLWVWKTSFKLLILWEDILG